MDLDANGQEELGDTDKMNMLVGALDGTAFAVPSNVKYQYDYSATTYQRGKYVSDRLERFYEDNNRPPVPATSARTLRALAFQIAKVSERTTDHANREMTMSDLNSNFCKPCRRIFDGNGSFVLPMTKQEKGLYYSHWDTRVLKKSARTCLLCFQVDRAIGTPISGQELIPMHYDIVGFLKAEGVFATRFSCYAIVGSGKKLEPFVVSQAMITMEPVDRNTPTVRPLELPEPALKATTSPESHTLLSQWLHMCDVSHKCMQDTNNISHDLDFLPTRLVDVGVDKDADFVRLIDSKELKSVPRYLTLSHSWGSSEVAMTFQLTWKNCSSLRKQFFLQQLPKTLADTILVSRHLGIRYAWIDSLCIMQDDPKDLKREAATMWQVYSNAYVNIAATASSNSSQGLVRGRNPRVTQPCVAMVREKHPVLPAVGYRCYNAAEWISQIKKAPLNKRAWVHQEWLLSPRIVHFAQDQIFWECHESHFSECFPRGIPARYRFGIPRFSLGSTEGIHKERFLEIWSSIVREYTIRELTYDSDKLLAASGLARTLSRKCPAAGRYVAGIWENYAVDQLLWSSSLLARRAVDYRSPTWSWASMNGSIEPNFNWQHQDQEDGGQRCRSPVALLGIDAAFQDDPFDSVTAATLRLETPLLKVTIEPGENHSEDGFYSEPQQMMLNAAAGTVSTTDDRPAPFADRDFRFEFITWNPPHRGGARGRLDDDRDISERPSLFFMPLLSFNSIDKRYRDELPDVDELAGLMLEPTGVKRGEFKRCGTCSLEEWVVGLFLCDLGNQDLEEAMYEERRVDAIDLDDMVPSNWTGKNLDFIPKRFDRFVISIV